MIPTFEDFNGDPVAISPECPLPVSDSRFQILIGNVDGFELLIIPGETFLVLKTSFTDLTPTGGVQELPTSAETWEIVSTDATDTSAGTGAQTVSVVSLDADYNLQATTAVLNGLTPVILANTHFRTRNATVLTAGANPINTNVGEIIIRVSGGGTERMRIPAAIGDCKSLIYTVPAGKSSFIQQIGLFCKKNEDCVLETLITPQNGATVVNSRLSTYQNAQVIRIVGTVALPEKTDLVVRISSTTNNTTALAFYTFLEVENTKIANPPVEVRGFP